jgi:zinc and cadmium transporter
MLDLVTYIILSVLAISLISLIGVFTLAINNAKLHKVLLYMVSFSVGALLGDVFIHLLPEAFDAADPERIGIYVLSGILFSFIIEKFIHWRHCHLPESESHVHSFAYVNLIGDSLHNFIDGIILAGAYFISIPVGMATTVAIILHEIPQEIGDFGVLLHGGFTKAKALFWNFITALTAILGAIVGIFLGSSSSTLSFLIPFAAGNFIYVAGSDLIPELHKDNRQTISATKNFLQLFFIILGISMMYLLIFIE